jgi:hypothetical protein
MLPPEAPPAMGAPAPPPPAGPWARAGLTINKPTVLVSTSNVFFMEILLLLFTRRFRSAERTYWINNPE